MWDMFGNILGLFWKCLGHVGNCWDVLCYFCVILGHVGIGWDVFGCV